MKVYLDNNIASAVAKHDLAPQEMTAVDQLLGMQDAGTVRLETSRASLREMERTQNEKRRREVIEGLNRLHVVQHDHRVLGFASQSDPYGGLVSYPLVTDVTDDLIFSELTQMSLDEDDAKHLTNAISGGWEVFLTTDPDFLDLRVQIQMCFPSIRVMKPSELLAELKQNV